MTPQDGTQRLNIKVSCTVDIVQKHHQSSGELIRREVSRLLTKSPNHAHGIKVHLEVGRVKVLEDD